MEPVAIAIPSGWGARLVDEADLESSFAEIEFVDSFDGEVLKAKVRLIQCRLKEASAHLKAAVEAQRRQKLALRPSSPLRRFGVCRELALVRGTVDPMPILTPDPELFGPAERPYALYLRALDAAEALYCGHSDAARGIYSGLLKAEIVSPENSAIWHAQLAACNYNEGDRAQALRDLEVAGLFFGMLAAPKLARARLASKLSALYEAMGCRAERDAWAANLASIDCPEATKEAFRRRGQLMALRSAWKERLVAF